MSVNLTQEELSKELRIDRSTVAKWETRGVMPRADKLPALAKLFGCQIDDLFLERKALENGDFSQAQ